MPPSPPAMLRSTITTPTTTTITSTPKLYTNRWALRIEAGRREAADELAAKYGFVNLGPVIEGEEYYLFESASTRRKSARRARNLQSEYIAREENVSI